MTREEKIYNECLNAVTSAEVLSALFAEQKLNYDLRSIMFQRFEEADSKFTKTMLLTLTPLPDPQRIEYQDEDFRQLERISKWESKIKDGMKVNDALRPEVVVDFDEGASEKEERARQFVETMQREATERHLRFKQNAEKRLAAIEQEEKERERARQRELLEQVKKRQQETLLKLQAVEVFEIGQREKRDRP